ncbi:MAG: hypothetical protein LBO66_07185 [Deltaproteobacteria bacterium]|jgi:ADP-heptose:LPS heptosyltransferase|nr:hypothetical protein [Deltaproteobacteria bacterium]
MNYSSFVGFQLKNLGDALACLPALAFLRARGVQAALVARPAAARLLTPTLGEEGVIRADFKSKAWDLAGNLSLIGTLRAKGFQAALGFDHKRRSGLLSFLAGHKTRVLAPIPGYDAPAWPWRAVSAAPLTGRTGRPPNLIHMAESHVFLAALLAGEEPAELTPALYPRPPAVGEDERARARALLESLPPGDGPAVGLCLRGRQREKSWPLPLARASAEFLAQRVGARFFLTGEAADGEIFRALKGICAAPLADLTGKTSLGEFLALLSVLDLFVSVDTGSAHLAALMGTPLIAIYAVTSPAQWAPLGGPSRLLCYNQALSRHGLPAEAPSGVAPWVALKAVGPRDIWGAAESLGAETAAKWLK